MISHRQSAVFIVDDHAVVREGLVKLISQELDMRVGGEAEDGPSALKQLFDMQPDIAIVDISLSSSNGLDLIKGMKLRYPDMPVLVFSMHEESIYAERALRAGACGYVMKSEAPTILIAAIRKCLNGKIHLSEKMTEQLLYRVINRRDDKGESGIESLSDREFQVFRMVGKGIASRQIARDLNLSVKTIDAFRENIKRKLGLRNAAELTRYAIECVHSRNLD
ncbi:MAG: response regulator transcription factor [Desulfuromonadales bacterium]|nr:response regulator transcription factor [Desulfuromonadales bacterium]